MQSILDAINEWIKEILIGAINGNLSTMFGDVNEKVGTIANEVGQTPQGWNANIFSMIQTLSENVIVPIAGLVITYVLCYELISMVTEKNNMHDIETFMFFKWIFKAFVAVFIVTNTFNITMAVFDMAQHIVSGAVGVIGGDTNIDVAEALAAMQEGLEDMEIPELLLLVLETSLVSLCMKIMSVLITVILYGRMIEIYLYCSVSPIPFATMTNREWGQIGNNYLKGLFALGFQGFLMPILGDLYDELLRQPEPEAARIAAALELYVSGSLNVFNHRTNVELSNRLVCFDIKQLGKQLKKLGMLIVQDQTWNRVTINRAEKKSTRYYMDEFHLLLKEEQTAAYSVEIWKRFRKWGGIPTAITQNVKDLLASREVENIFENSDFVLMLNQAQGDRTILAKQLNISPQQMKYVTHTEAGEGLIFYGNVVLPFVDRFPKDTELYRVMTTKPEEVSESGK